MGVEALEVADLRPVQTAIKPTIGIVADPAAYHRADCTEKCSGKAQFERSQLVGDADEYGVDRADSPAQDVRSAGQEEGGADDDADVVERAQDGEHGD